MKTIHTFVILSMLVVFSAFGQQTEERFTSMKREQQRAFEIEVMEKVADLALIPPKLNTSPLPKYDYDQLAYGMTIGISRTPGGRLWACWVAGEDGAKAFFVCAVSDDDGEKWSKPMLVIDGQSDKLPMPRSVLVGNLWTDPLGRLWILFNQSMAQFDGRSGVWAAICENPDAAKPLWSAPKRIWHGFTLNKPTVLSNGDWLLPISLNRAGFGPFNGAFKELDPFRGANAFLSKDKGATWQRQGHVQFPNPDWDEHSFIERKDGSLWMLARTGKGPMQSSSSDLGKTWSTPAAVESFSHPVSRLHLRKLASGRLLLVKHGETIDTNHGRKQLSAWLSDDEGKTWEGGLMLDERDGVSYPDGFQSSDGTIYISYDHNRATDGEILMARFNEDDILAKKLIGPKSKLKMLISRPLKPKENAAAPAKSAAAAPPPVNQAPIRVSPLHFRPKAGNAGDAIPFYWQGEYHVFYLSKEGLEWAHAVSTDLTHWRELPPAVTRGSSDQEPDGQNCWTGSIAEKDGTFHLFFTGQKVFDPKGEQKMMVATSKDLIRWEKQPQRTLYADGKIYWSKPVNGPAASVTSHHQAFRDADVFWNKDAQRWWMVLHTLTAEGHRPCFGLYTSPDLMKWTPQTPLGTYAMGVGLDCPNVMPMQGRWFIIASQAHFSSAAKAEGPYAPVDMQPYESGDLVVPKSLFDGKRRLIWGWIRDLKGGRDSGEGLWGGTLSLPREVYPGPDGQLYSQPAAEVTAAFTTTALDLTSAPAPGDTIGTWQYADKKLVCGPEGGSCSFKVPDDYLLQCTVQLDPKAILTLNMRQRQPGSGYPLLIHPENQLVSLKRGSSEFSRRVKFDANQPVTIQAYVQGAIIECFINDRHAFTCRAYDFATGNLGLKVTGGQMQVLDLKVKKLPPARS